MSFDVNLLSGLVNARVSMGAQLDNIATPVIAVPEFGKDGTIEIAGDGIAIGPNGEITVGGIQVLLYIQDTGHSKHLLLSEPEKSKKYHLVHCSVLERMLESKRFDRYVVTERTDGAFPVHCREVDRTTSKLEARLAPCKICLKHIGYFFDRRDFDIAEFFRSYGDSEFSVLPSSSDVDNRSSDYSADWSQISKLARQTRNWRCEKCKVNLSNHENLLHVHHKDGVRSNNVSSNLEVLCALCHQDMPCHGHMRVGGSDRKLIIEARNKNQGYRLSA